MPDLPPILNHKSYQAASVFSPENLLREARRQKSIANSGVPRVCVLDPDGDIVEYLVTAGLARCHDQWACYHTWMYTFDLAGVECGIVGMAVGASFAVLVAEELFASGCQLLISLTSAGQIVSRGTPPYFVLIERALRDEGTSYHYLPPAPYSEINRALLASLEDTFDQAPIKVWRGATWTTDAPFRETEAAIEFARAEGVLGVEMEAAALYAFAQARSKDVVCLAHITNQMGGVDNDFEKGAAQGAHDALEVLRLIVHRWRSVTG